MNIAICYDETMIRRHLALAEEGGGIPGFLDTYGSAGELLATRKAYDLVLIDGRTLRDMQRRSTGMGRRKDRRGTEDGFFRVLSHGQEIKIRCQEILYAENDLKKIILHISITMEDGGR